MAGKPINLIFWYSGGKMKSLESAAESQTPAAREGFQLEVRRLGCVRVDDIQENIQPGYREK